MSVYWCLCGRVTCIRLYVCMKLGVSIQTYEDRQCQAFHIELQYTRKLTAAVLLERAKDARAFPTWVVVSAIQDRTHSSLVTRSQFIIRHAHPYPATSPLSYSSFPHSNFFKKIKLFVHKNSGIMAECFALSISIPAKDSLLSFHYTSIVRLWR